MRIHFQVNCHTIWGQNLYLSYFSEESDREDTLSTTRMEYTKGDIWETDIYVPDNPTNRYYYRYFIKDDNGAITNEGIRQRNFYLNTKTAFYRNRQNLSILVKDTWFSPSEPTSLYFTSAFSKVIFRQKNNRQDTKERKGERRTDIKKKIRLQVFVPWMPIEGRVYVAGSTPMLGGWDTSKALEMGEGDSYLWSTELATDEKGSFEYKYIIKDREGRTILWEDGANRRLAIPACDALVVTDNMFRFRQLWRGAGVAVPVFSLRTDKSLGVGEFSDLKLLADWAEQSGLSLIQILPVQDTTRQMGWMDAYPYSCVSVFALHPLYLNLDAMGTVTAGIKREISKWKGILKELESLDYEKVMSVKIRLARKIYRVNKKKFLDSKGFQAFLSENGFWLKSYAVFCVLRDIYKTSDFKQWGKLSSITEEQTNSLVSPESEYYDEVCFYYFLQYHLHLQLIDASRYAISRGIVLKGDIPIGVHPESHDCWVNPKIFHMDRSAGAPPDPFSDDGQNWGFPTYNWEEMARDDYLWWRRRLNIMSIYFQMVRLDHVLGFFRIWEIPKGSYSGIMGRFNPAIPISMAELENEGIYDIRRLCDPYIPYWFLKEIFGNKADYVAEKFLEGHGLDFYLIKPEFSTQAKIDAYLRNTEYSTQDDVAKNDMLKKNLFRLLANIILFYDPVTGGFHPRINMMDTVSFSCLDEWIKQKLIMLYNDYFYRRQDNLWRSQAMIKLPVLKSASDMLICGEDLGMIPDCVPPVMEELCLLGLRIQRMPKEPDREFGYPSDYHYMTVCTTSSHDMSTIRGWWEEDRDRARRYYRTILCQQDEAPQECTPDICRDIICQHLQSPSMWAIFPIQDILGMSVSSRRPGDPSEEQINNPADPYHRWKFRLHLTLEELINMKDFSASIKDMIKQSGRHIKA